MIEQTGDLWDRHQAGEWICVTTNGMVKSGGYPVMGRGIARECAKKFPQFPALLGARLRDGNHVYPFAEYRIFTFPTKHFWWEKSDIDLIAVSVKELNEAITRLKLSRVFLPRPGCGNGKLEWADVKPLLVGCDDRFVVMDRSA